MASVILTRSRKKRLEAGHPWVFGTEIDTVEGEPQPGAVVGVYDHARRFLASGYYNPQSQIRVRVVDYKPVQDMDAAFFRGRFERCREHRRRFLPEADACRLVYGERTCSPVLSSINSATCLSYKSLPSAWTCGGKRS